MPASVFTEKENGDLKLVAEIDDDVQDGEAVELLLEENPRLKAQKFVVLIGSLEDGEISTVSQQEVKEIKWSSSRNGNKVDEQEEQEEEEAPAPKRRGRPPGSKNKPKDDDDAGTTTRRRPGPKAGAKRGTTDAPKRRGRPPGSKNKPKTGTTSRRGSSPFRRNAGSDE